MIATIMPSFVDVNGQPRPEGVVVGRLLAGYGDIAIAASAIKNPTSDLGTKFLEVVEAGKSAIMRRSSPAIQHYRCRPCLLHQFEGQ